MATVKISKKSLLALSKISASQVEPILTELGIPLEGADGDILHLEITPNRPDWLSVEGVARSCKSYSCAKAGIYRARKSVQDVSIDSSVLSIRPFFYGAYASGVRLNEQSLQSLIQLQEKLHDTLGRNRKKVAIGIHDSKPLSPPFTYSAVAPRDVSFVPLGMDSKLTCEKILAEHPTGIKYSHLVSASCPIIRDKKGNVLSFPPIINGELTKLTVSSTNLFIDCTGTHEGAVFTAAAIISAALADMGATIHNISINKKECDIFKMRKMPFSLYEANKLLGTSLTLAQAKRHLARTGHVLEGNHTLSPSFRADILHSVDLIEDIAISIGYNNFDFKTCDFASVGKSFGHTLLHESCLGLGYFEVSSWILTNSQTLENSLVPQEHAIRVNNPLTQEFTTLRPALYPNLLDIFSKSKSQQMPQNIYEFGPITGLVAGSPIQSEHLCIASAHPKSSFSKICSHLKALLTRFGAQYALVESDRDGFIPGRCAKIIVDSKDVGLIGEIHPEVLENFSIEQPVAIAEFDCSFLKPYIRE